MRRREFARLVAATVAWPIAASAQMMTRRGIMAASLGVLAARVSAQSNNPPLVGGLFLSDLERSYNWKHLKKSLGELGYIEGANIRYAGRSTYDAAELPGLAAQIAALSPAVVYANGDEPARIAARQWTTTPIVAMTDDHIGAGLSDSYAHPSRNITGISRLEAELDTKRLEILHDLVPSARVILVLRDPQTAWPERGAALDRAARLMRTELAIRDVRDTADVDAAVAAGRAAGAAALLVLGSPLLTAPQFDDHIRQAAIGGRLPTMVQVPSQADRLGSLASYGVDQDALLLRLAEMIDRILKGAKPDSIPIEQPSKFRLIVNLKTAKAIGLEVPPAVLTRADEVIE